MKSGSLDVLEGLLNIKLPMFLAFSDIRQRYRRSTLGPFWITLSTAIMISCIGFIFGTIFKAPLKEFLPFLTAGLITWSFITSTINEATHVFVSAEPIIKQLPIPLFSHVIRMVARNGYIFFHNIVIFPFVCLITGKEIGLEVLLFVPCFFLLIVNLLWVSLFLGTVCTRFRDLGQIVASLLQVAFYVTPIIWMPSLMPERFSKWILEINPFYQQLELIRCPLLSTLPSNLAVYYTLGVCLFGWVGTVVLFNKYRDRIAYWL